MLKKSKILIIYRGVHQLSVQHVWHTYILNYIFKIYYISFKIFTIIYTFNIKNLLIPIVKAEEMLITFPLKSIGYVNLDLFFNFIWFA